MERKVAWLLVVALVIAGCADIVGANFDDRGLRPGGTGADGGGAAGGSSGNGAGGVGGVGGSGGSGAGTTSAGGGEGCLCVDVPDPWQGPVALWFGDDQDTPPTCSDLHPDLGPVIDGRAGLSASPASCQSCSCDASAVSCGPVSVSLYAANNSCNPSNECFSGSIPADTCVEVCGVGAINSLIYTGFPSDSGSCTPVPETQTPSLPPVTWVNAARVCAGGGEVGDCTGSEVCLPHPGNGPGIQRPCVYQHLDGLTCPSGFGDKHVIHSGDSDTRGCSECDCFGATCGPFALQFTIGDATCGGQTATPTAAPNQCVVLADIQGGQNGIMYHETPSCMFSGGAPTGGVTATNPTTLCCAPSR